MKYSLISIIFEKSKVFYETNDFLEATTKLQEIKTQYQNGQRKYFIYLLNNESQDMEYYICNYEQNELQKNNLIGNYLDIQDLKFIAFMFNQITKNNKNYNAFFKMLSKSLKMTEQEEEEKIQKTKERFEQILNFINHYLVDNEETPQ